MKIETYIYVENKKRFVPIDDIEKIKTFVAAKEDFMEQGFTNLEGTITKGTERFIIQVYP
ncbi:MULTISPECIES: hypothetical protein [unclassified Bacillus (in: firmicutes)]|uniref:hypothetical protein n=1 Tax=unclassified Bacillus (in: firmicutes) TaxID=185979 RepID=UPI000D041472|nr:MULTISPECIES: hypothetical protein [unclassified Bacillus (in: firmicutes)]PRR90318.1 hypothetical protein C6W21_11340 [Bacillus sp. NMCN1]PRR98095.1 hypothetical protein C6W20_10970 [Bacillus sp. NMCN6]